MDDNSKLAPAQCTQAYSRDYSYIRVYMSCVCVCALPQTKTRRAVSSGLFGVPVDRVTRFGMNLHVQTLVTDFEDASSQCQLRQKSGEQGLPPPACTEHPA